jgi:hypothetical protein
MEDLPDNLQGRIGYRIDDDEAARLAEMAMFDHRSRLDVAAGIGGKAHTIEREVTRRLRPGIQPDMVKLAVQDAVEGRKPRW